MYVIYERTAYRETIIGRFETADEARYSLKIVDFFYDAENDAYDVFTTDGRVLAIEKVKG